MIFFKKERKRKIIEEDSKIKIFTLRVKIIKLKVKDFIINRIFSILQRLNKHKQIHI